MPKLTLQNLANLQNEATATATINANNVAASTALENTLSRDGSLPNSMDADFDMNSNHILNLPAPLTDGEPVRKEDLDNAMLGEYSGQVINGTANEITASTVAVTTTLSLPNAITLTGKTLTGGSFVTPTLGTPASVTLTNGTGLPVSTGISGLGTGVGTFLATPSSANLLAAMTDETGTGSNVFATSPTLVTPVLGNATGTSLILGNTDPHPAYTNRLCIGGAATNSEIFVGQPGPTGLALLWSYNATPANASAVLATLSYANPFSIDGSAITLNTNSNGLTTVNKFANKAPVTITGTSGTLDTLSNGANSVIFNGSGTYTLTLPAASTNTGRWLTIKSIVAQALNSASSNVVPRIGGAAATGILASGAGNWAILQSDGTNWIIMASN